MITRDGDFFCIGDERVPGRTECAGVMLEWRQWNDTAGLVSFSLADCRLLLEVDGRWEITDASVELEWCGHEPTVLAAQRRVLRVLAALTEKLEG